MALGNKILLGEECYDTSTDEKVETKIKGVRKVKPKFAPGMRFPCQE